MKAERETGIPQEIRTLKMRLVSPWAIAVFLLLGSLLPFTGPYTSLAAECVIFALFAMSFNILLGFTGLLSFGHAAFFGLGALGAGLAMARLHASFLTALGLGALLALLAALIIGFFCLKAHGISFAFLTLAFAELLYFVAYQWTAFTGGEDGLAVTRSPLNLLFTSVSLKNSTARYYAIFAVVALCVLLINRILNSPFGRVLASMRENEQRTTFLGYNTTAYKLMSFCLSGLFSGIAGALYTFHLAFVPMENLHWSISGEIVIITLLGGTGYLFGPALGTILFVGLREVISGFFERWQLFVGVIFVLIVIFAPEGTFGIPARVRMALRQRKEARAAGAVSGEEGS